MRTTLSKRNIFRIALPMLVLLGLTMFVLFLPSKDRTESAAQFDELNQAWQAKLLSINPEREDPRKDNDSLYAASEYRGEVISVSRYEENSNKFLTGTGWLLTGGVTDLIDKGNVTYILYCRQVERFNAGFWNNSLDLERSFSDFFVVKYEYGQATILEHRRLGPHYSQTSVGLRLGKDGTIEVLQNTSRSTASDAEVMGSYM